MSFISDLRAWRAKRAAGAANTYQDLVDAAARLNGTPPDAAFIRRAEGILAERNISDDQFEQHLELRRKVISLEAKVEALDAAKAQRTAAKAESELADLREDQRRQREAWRERETAIKARLEPAQEVIRQHTKLHGSLQLARADLARALEPGRFAGLDEVRSKSQRLQGEGNRVRGQLRELAREDEQVFLVRTDPTDFGSPEKKVTGAELNAKERERLQAELARIETAQREAREELAAAGLDP